ncbi:hypothetical protein BGX26_003488 [Mortierella sp. AD094]|nr:hypothetical protein BGX26_003488 [Mortierella sp. AD094]
MQGFEFRYGRHSTFRDIAKLVSDPLQFPKLSRLTLGSMTLEDQECLPIVEGVKNRIKEFSAYSLVTARSLYPLYSGLATQWSDTLEVLRFQHSDVSSQQIRLLLTSCSKLKTFSVFTAFRGDDDLYAPDSTGLAVWSDNCAVDWVQDWQAPDTVIRLQESRTADGIKDVYRQLGRLTKLRYLRIGWSSTKHFEEKCNLNLSMGSGLRHLESLKDLRVLDVGCITRVNVGQLEVEWMVKNWPRIRTIKGLFIKEGRNHRGMMMPADDFEKVDEGFVSRILGLPDHIDWIRIQKPHILVS